MGAASYSTGDRMSTLMFYLSEVQAGGFTVFPRLGVWSSPSPGSAVFWHNIQRDGWSDMAMLHGGCPVLLGRKIVANKWIRLEWSTLIGRDPSRYSALIGGTFLTMLAP